MTKKCSACGKIDPLSSHRCFIFGKGRAVNVIPDKNSPSERLYRRIIAEFPDWKDDMIDSKNRPERERRKCQWSWSYWPIAQFRIGSSWSMREVLQSKEWTIIRIGCDLDININQHNQVGD